MGCMCFKTHATNARPGQALPKGFWTLSRAGKVWLLLARDGPPCLPNGLHKNQQRVGVAGVGNAIQIQAGIPGIRRRLFKFFLPSCLEQSAKPLGQPCKLAAGCIAAAQGIRRGRVAPAEDPAKGGNGFGRVAGKLGAARFVPPIYILLPSRKIAFSRPTCPRAIMGMERAGTSIHIHDYCSQILALPVIAIGRAFGNCRGRVTSADGSSSSNFA